MAQAPFKPYWRPVAGPVSGGPTDPYSWAFFAVAQIGGRHRPVAVVSTLRGYPLTAACHRIVTIFSDQANHRAIRAELALASGYYVRDGNREYSPQLVELPDFNRRDGNPRLRRRSWYHTNVREFPFISACLLQGVAFDAQQELARPAFPEPLGTVYRDTSIEWGMVVVDITNLDAVSYGIVGFGVGPMTFIGSRKHEKHPPDYDGIGFNFVRGTLRVMDEVRPRRAMSAAEYMTEVDYASPPTNNIDRLIAKVPLINVSAMDLVWPPSIEEDIEMLLGRLLDANKSVLDQYRATTSLIQRILELEEPDMSVLKQARTMPHFQEIFSRVLLQDPARLLTMDSSNRLITMAFLNGEHLSLEQLINLPVEAISAILSAPNMAKVTSISICIDRVQGTPAQLVNALARVERLRKLYFLQSPIRESDALSGQLFVELAAYPQILQRTTIMFAGACTAAQRMRLWLPSAPTASGVQLAPLDIFPVQQILVLDQMYKTAEDRIYIHLGDALLKPERFAAGFLIYMQSLLTSTDEFIIQPLNLFSFSSAPSFLDGDPETAAEISPILAESFSVPEDMPRGKNNNNPYRRRWAQMRDLDPKGWTVIVSLETHKSSRSLRSPYACHCIRYAFIRALQQPIVVDHSRLVSPGPKELEAVVLKEFLDATGAEVADDVIDRRIQQVGERIARKPYEGPLFLKDRISVLSQEDAAEILLGFLEDAVEVRNILSAAINEDFEERN
ncbi:hypothetical protein VE02_05221 [Pseudogymnoascus sp. 03VT05]|nr:hypothetical protein VE02_05221 [Pseudogymnoascus sp. 03VT05]